MQMYILYPFLAHVCERAMWQKQRDPTKQNQWKGYLCVYLWSTVKYVYTVCLCSAAHLDAGGECEQGQKKEGLWHPLVLQLLLGGGVRGVGGVHLIRGLHLGSLHCLDNTHMKMDVILPTPVHDHSLSCDNIGTFSVTVMHALYFSISYAHMYAFIYA